jgi:hypothetical protein
MFIFNNQIDDFFKMYSHRNWSAVVNYFLTKFYVPWHERTAELSEGKFLMATDELSLVDIHIGPIWETLYMLYKGPMKEELKSLELETKAPLLIQYVERFREHPAIKPYRLDEKIV